MTRAMIPSHRRLFMLGAMVALAAPLAGCGDRDPYRRTDVWRPTGANAANIAAQVADPNDMIRGRSSVPRANAEPSALAVDRIQTDHPKVLRGMGGSGGSSGGDSGSGMGAGGAGGGAVVDDAGLAARFFPRLGPRARRQIGR